MAPAQFQPLIEQAAAQYGIPADVLTRLLYQESRFRPDIISGQTVSRAGAQGIAQFMPATAAELGVDPLNPESAIPGAARYLAQLQKQFGGDLQRAVAAYNAGPGRVSSLGGDLSRLPAETRAYLAAVLPNQGTALPAFSWSPPAATPAVQASAAREPASSLGLLGALPAAGDSFGGSSTGLLGGMEEQAPTLLPMPPPQSYRPRNSFRPAKRRAFS